MDINDLGKSRIVAPTIQGGIIYKDALADLSTLYLFKQPLILFSQYKNRFGFGDEYHPDPRATYYLGLHSTYQFGSAMESLKEYGIVSIRLGELDTIINVDHVIFYGESRSSNDVTKPTYKSKHFILSFQSQHSIRVLLSAKVTSTYAPRKAAPSQYNFGDMYTHSYKYNEDKKLWEFILRRSPRSITSDSMPEYCRCCELDK